MISECLRADSARDVPPLYCGAQPPRAQSRLVVISASRMMRAQSSPPCPYGHNGCKTVPCLSINGLMQRGRLSYYSFISVMDWLNRLISFLLHRQYADHSD